jgi:hypothetical protein
MLNVNTRGPERRYDLKILPQMVGGRESNYGAQAAIACDGKVCRFTCCARPGR